MAPRDLDPETVVARLAHLEELMDVLEGMGDLGDVSGDPVRRLAVERILTQSVDIVVDVSSHIAITQTGRSPTTYREAVERVARLDILAEEVGHDLARAVGMRNVLVHEYLAVDHEIVRAAAEAAPSLFGAFQRSVASWLTDRP